MNPNNLESEQSYTQRGKFGYGMNADEHPEDCTCWRCELNKEGTTDLEAYKENYLTCTRSVDI